MVVVGGGSGGGGTGKKKNQAERAELLLEGSDRTPSPRPPPLFQAPILDRLFGCALLVTRTVSAGEDRYRWGPEGMGVPGDRSRTLSPGWLGSVDGDYPPAQTHMDDRPETGSVCVSRGILRA